MVPSGLQSDSRRDRVSDAGVWYKDEERHTKRSGANGKATVPGVGFDSLGRGVGRTPGTARIGARPEFVTTR